ncbi:MAG TPA: hypothetical protein VG167_11055 [Verrucomicrobiae bacterium]|nr:hypothetical protein [Verrucomicrobiae bacterium]
MGIPRVFKADDEYDANTHGAGAKMPFSARGFDELGRVARAAAG